MIKIGANAYLKTKWRVRPVFSITLHIKDLALLEAIQNTLGIGNISKSKKMAIFAVDSIKDISVIINHFDQYPLISYKLSDYLIFKKCFEIINKGKHLTDNGLLEILSLKSTLNLGLPDNLKIQAKDRPEYKFKGIPDPFWVSGFTSGEGSFQIVFRNTDLMKGVFARFSLHLHIRDLDLLNGLRIYFKEHSIVTPSITEKKIIILEKSANMQMTKFSDIINIIIPFFNQYPLLGMKSLDFEDFKKVCLIMKTKDYLTSPSVVNQILKIKAGMNLNRSE
jgi:hypothetical protein